MPPSINGKAELLADSLEVDLFTRESKNVKLEDNTDGRESPNASKVPSFPREVLITELAESREVPKPRRLTESDYD